jgi:anti-anti-sigma factor
MRLDGFFAMAASLSEAQALLSKNGNRSVQLKSTPASGLPTLAWTGEVTASNAEEVWIATRDHVAARSLLQRPVRIDLSNLQFIDSTGLSIMIRAKKFGARENVPIIFSDPCPNVLNVIRLSRLEDYLLKNAA